MILDSTELAEEPAEELSADVLIIGAGINGTVLAAELDDAGVSVVLVEAGGRGSDETDGDRWEAETTRAVFGGAKIGRRRGFGGSGAWWAGQCAPFDPIDLEPRAWVEHSGWPVGWSELALWYPKASAVLGIASESFTDDQWLRRGVEPLRGMEHKFSAFLPQPNIAQLLLPKLSASEHVRVVLHAYVRRVVRDPHSGRIGGAQIITAPLHRGGRSRSISAPVVVLAAGGIESPRILLASATGREPGGVGNAHDLVGRYLHDHPNGVAAQIVPNDRRRFDDLYGMLYAPRSTNPARSWARIPLPAAAQREQQVLNAIANVDFDDEVSPLGAVKRLVRHVRGSHPIGPQHALTDLAKGALAGLPMVPGVAWRRYARGLSPAHTHGSVWLRTASEQPPRPGSRVTLASSDDEWGVPRALIDWKLGEEERQAQRALVETIADAWARAGIATVRPLSWLTADEDWRLHQVDALHHSGTLRMASSPRFGVVGRDLECHDVPGLFVAGSAVFPTSSNANPTFTSVALTLRLARHLTHQVLPKRSRLKSHGSVSGRLGQLAGAED